MPGVYMEDQQAWQIVSYVRSLGAQPAKRDVPGNREAGMEIFRGKGNCLQCHLANGEGGRFGPDLSDVGGQRTPAFLKTALLEPGKEVRQAWWTYRLSTKSGEQVSGLCLNEDTYSIQVLDEKSRLRSFAKNDLTNVQIAKESTMPSYKSMLNQSELDNLIAYLVSLRRK